MVINENENKTPISNYKHEAVELINIVVQNENETIITVTNTDDSNEKGEIKTEGETWAFLEKVIYDNDKQVPQHEQTFIVAPVHRRRDSDDDDLFASSFDDLHVRHKFIRKVFMILTTQLTFTTLSICAAIFLPQIKKIIVLNLYTLIAVAIILYTLSSMTILCCENMRRTFPINYFLLIAFTVAETIFCLVITILVNPFNVLIAIGITAALCFCLTLFAIQTSWDITGCAGYLYAALLILMMYGFVIAGLQFSGVDIKVANVIYGALGILVFSWMLIYDVQLVMGGKQFQLSEEDYILAAMTIYIDIIYIFVEILQLLEILNN